MSSILNDVKHMLGHPPEVTEFDEDIKIFLNGAFGTLTQLGVGPAVGFQITGPDEQWESFYTDPRLNSVMSYLFLCAKMQFDPPDTGFTLQAMERQKQELEFRLNVVAEYG